MQKYSPCVFCQAHSKEDTCRAPEKKHTANNFAQGEFTRCRVSPDQQTTNSYFAVCLDPGTRQTTNSRSHPRRPSGEGGGGLWRLSWPLPFAVCQRHVTWQNWLFVVCLAPGTRQTSDHRAPLPRIGRIWAVRHVFSFWRTVNVF